MAEPIDLSEIGVDTPEEPNPESPPPPEPESPQPPAPVETPEEEPLEGPEDYSPRERMLLKRLEEMTQANIERGGSQPVDEVPAPEPVDHNFMDGLDIDEVISDPAAMNKLLLNVYNRGLAEASKLAAENILRSLPNTVSRYVQNHVTMNEVVRDFYERNPDLKAVRRTVAAVANDIAAQEPGLSTQQLFDRAADKTREILQLRRVAANNARKTPAFARQRGRSVTPELSGLQREIDELISRR